MGNLLRKSDKSGGQELGQWPDQPVLLANNQVRHTSTILERNHISTRVRDLLGDSQTKIAQPSNPSEKICTEALDLQIKVQLLEKNLSELRVGMTELQEKLRKMEKCCPNNHSAQFRSN
jgi:hypothetical protein